MSQAADTEVLHVGARVWLVTSNNPDEWTPATTSVSDGVEVVFKSDYGQETRMWLAEVTSSTVKPMSGSRSDAVEDMSKLSELNQASILCNLNARYSSDFIYTYIGSILISVNPYKQIENLYNDEMLEKYLDTPLGEAPPHVYAIANECYSCMWKREESQSILISGESGAGKTETTKFMLRFLSHASQLRSRKSGGGEQKSSIENSILESGPLLEAFGNAKTVYNNNSSRFGKFIQLLFGETGGIQGGRITDYLLEKHRVVRQNPGERNYHVFYQLIFGSTPEQREELFLNSAEDFYYLNTTGCISDPSLDDGAHWSSLINALGVIGFKEGQTQDMTSVLAGILHLGNVSFMNAGGAQVQEFDALERAAQLLGLDSYRLEAALKEKVMKLRGENITSPQSVEQAQASRDSIAMALYAQLFHWIIAKINHRIKGPDDFRFIGILDIFGFENFEVNRFEQFCINFANEKLQEFFNRHIFSLEQLEYNREGIDWCDVEWTDNSECLDLIEKKMGILSLINEESRFPKGTDQSLLTKLHNNHGKNTFYEKPKVAGTQYGIKHYAGSVLYNITGFLEKNRDTFRDDLLALLKDSSNDLIYELFEKMRPTSESGGKGRNKAPTTASGQFKKSLHSLMERLSSANPFFVRCIKPNIIKVAEDFNAGVVLNQLKYSGMLETVRVRRAGFPVRRIFKDFMDRYWVIEGKKNENHQESARNVLNIVDDSTKLWRIGKTKIFMKESLEQVLEAARAIKVKGAATIVQSVVRTVILRRKFLKIKKSVVTCQKICRGFTKRKQYKKTWKAIQTMQKYERGRIARALFRVLLAEKRERDRKKLEATIVFQKYTRGWKMRKTFKVLLEKHRQLKALKEQMERERIEREKREQEERDRLIQEEKERMEKEKQQKLQFENEIEAHQEAENAEEETLIESMKRSEEDHTSVIAGLDAILNEAELNLNIDSAYSTVNKRTSQQMSEEEIQELERIEQLQREIEELHQASERASLTTTEAEPISQATAIEDSNIWDEDDDSSKDLLQDLGFEDFESQLDQMMETTHEIPTMQSDEELAPQYVEEIPEKIPEEVVLEEPDESYYSDSSFWSDDEDTGSISHEDSDTLLTGHDVWQPAVLCKGYVQFKGGLKWKKRWCVLREDLLMFFRAAQDGIKCGWMMKKSGQGGRKMGSIRGTITRSSWHKRWFVLTKTELKYFENDEENAKLKGTIDIRKCTEITTDTDRENGIDIIMNNSKTHSLATDTEEDASEWMHILMKIQTCTAEEIANFQTEGADPKNAITSVEVHDIDNINESDVKGKENTFAVTTNERVINLAATSEVELRDWLANVEIARENASGHSAAGESGLQGWMHRVQEVRNRITYHQQWFKLTQNLVEYYKNSHANSQKLGSISLNSLCVIVPPDEVVFTQTGFYEVTIHGRRRTLRIASAAYEDAASWYSELQSVVDSHSIAVTRTEQLLNKIKTATVDAKHSNKAEMKTSDKLVGMIYKRNPALRQVSEPLRAPLTSLPYDHVRGHIEHFTLRDEAIRIFNELLKMEDIMYPSPMEEARDIKAILESCQSYPLLQNELYLQLVKQTAVYETPLESMEETEKQQHVTSCLHYWHTLACMSCAYLPSRKVEQYAQIHFERVQRLHPETIAADYASFSSKALKKTRHREQAPGFQEITTVLKLEPLVTTIHCYGGATCEINLHSATTAGEVVGKLLRGMQLEGDKNTFALFEKNDTEEKAIESNTYIADIISKFERLNDSLQSNGKRKWILYFKLFCVFDPMAAPEDSVEYLFLFEETHEQVIQGLFPANEETLIHLAALRLQFTLGDYKVIDWDKQMEQYYPVCRLREAYELNEDSVLPRRASFADFGRQQSMNGSVSSKKSFLGTLRIKSKKVSKIEEEGKEMNETLYTEELQHIRSNIADKWYKLKGCTQEAAVVQYVKIARKWSGFGYSLFRVQNLEAAFGSPLLTLGVAAEGVTVYKRGHQAEVDHFPYSRILSFGVASENLYRLEIEGRGEITLQTDQVTEIVKLMRGYVTALVRRRPARR